VCFLSSCFDRYETSAAGTWQPETNYIGFIRRVMKRVPLAPGSRQMDLQIMKKLME
jgi:hypothetical protein